MIYVDRTKVAVPEVLLSERASRERERVQKLLTSDKQHLDQLRITFSTLYGQARPALIELFHGKCAFCESSVTAESADVEHFRPKQGAANADGVKEQHYYAWLALEWDNLLIACQNCSRRYSDKGKIVGKGNLFPVTGARAPLLASVADCRAAEKPLLIDPCFDRPEQELTFDAAGSCVPLTERGRHTIELLNLNRDALIHERQRVWGQVESLVHASVASNVASGVKPGPGDLTALLSAQQPYAGAARAAFAKVTATLKDRQARDALTRDTLGAVDEAARDHVQKAVEKPRLGVRRKVLVSAEPIAATKAVARFGKKKHLPPFAHQRVRRIEIDYFKAIEHLALDLPDAPNAEEGPAVLLLGENACGKSTILEATALALLGTDEIAKLRLDAAEFIHRRTWDAPIDDAEPARVSVYFTDADTPITLTVDPKKKRFAGARKPATVLLGYGPRRFFADGSRRKPRDEPAEQLRTMFDPLAVIENPTRWLMDAPQGDFDAAVRALRPILLLADEAVVARPPEGHRRGKQIMLEVQGDVAPLNRLSEGYKTIVATGVDVMREMLEYWPDLESARGVVLIDELETHLHPRWKMRIVQRLRRAMPRVQFIATTHDPLCLRGLYDGEAQVLQRDDERRIERLVELPNVRGLSVEQLLTSEFFGLFSTEDPTLEDDVARYAALVAKPNRSEIEDRTLDEQRETVQTTMTVGAKPADQLLNQATNEYLLQRRQAAAAQRPALKRAAIDRVVDIWKSLDT